MKFSLKCKALGMLLAIGGNFHSNLNLEMGRYLVMNQTKDIHITIYEGKLYLLNFYYLKICSVLYSDLIKHVLS